MSARFAGIPHRIDLVKCRLALVQRVVEGEFSNMEELAEKLNLSRSTVSRFFSGRPTSLLTTNAIVAALNLRFEDVATPDVTTSSDS